MASPRKILFLAEAVTLAHVARPIALARALDPSRHSVAIACDSRYQKFLTGGPWQNLPLTSIPSERFLRALADGAPVYDAATLRAYVCDDLALIERFEPDLIVGDFRLSLSISARLANVPYATITNAYWSPFFRVDHFPLPSLPITKRLPLPLAQALFRLAQPLAFRLHCQPLNQVRREHGLPSLGSDLRRVYTDADFTLYADIPSLFPMDALPPTHHYLAPILWSPPVTLPDWWARLPGDQPVIYVTLGSSGQARLLPTVFEALADLPVTVIAATAGAPTAPPLPANVRVADYLPGTEAARRAQLVICNGGSLTSQQALAAGVPVLGIAGNMDQFLNMNPITAAGAGLTLRADRLTATAVRHCARQLIDTPAPPAAAKAIARDMASTETTPIAELFDSFIQTSPTRKGKAR